MVDATIEDEPSRIVLRGNPAKPDGEKSGEESHS
jgi:hypothetical protein